MEEPEFEPGLLNPSTALAPTSQLTSPNLTAESHLCSTLY